MVRPTEIGDGAGAAALFADELTVRYPRSAFPALDSITFSINSPVTFVVGQNGAGKTTLFRALLGSVRASAGSITANARFGYVPQEFELPPRVRLCDYLSYLAWLKGEWKSTIDSAVAEVLDHVGLADRARDRLGELSGGMRRRVGLAQALLGRSDIVLLDEPMAGLDPIARHGIRELLGDVARARRVLISSHLVEDIALMDGDVDVIVLHQGRLVHHGPRDSIPERHGKAGAAVRSLEQQLIDLMAGHRA